MSGLHIALIGPRGSGKSSTAVQLAGETGLPLSETDTMIEEREGQSVSGIFESMGEQRFREIESEVLEAVLSMPRRIISTGGGIVMNPGNRKLLSERTFSVYLRANPLALFRRIASDPASGKSRPPLTGLDPFQEMEVIAKMRDPLYRECAKLLLDTTRMKPPEVCRRILQELGER